MAHHRSSSSSHGKGTTAVPWSPCRTSLAPILIGLDVISVISPPVKTNFVFETAFNQSHIVQQDLSSMPRCFKGIRSQRHRKYASTCAEGTRNNILRILRMWAYSDVIFRTCWLRGKRWDGNIDHEYNCPQQRLQNAVMSDSHYGDAWPVRD